MSTFWPSLRRIVFAVATALAVVVVIIEYVLPVWLSLQIS
jgi:hypothetical protein